MPDLELVDVALGRSPADLVIRGGSLVNVFTEEIYPADVAVSGTKIAAVGDVSGQAGPDTRVVDASGAFLVPGLIDGHLHVECSKLSLTMFAHAVVPLGTTSIVSGLDQIFVVAGLAGVREFLDEAALGPLGVFWGAPSKLPYTFPESTVGHTFGPAEHAEAQGWPECVGLWETVQEFVFERDPKVMDAMDLAARRRLPVLSCAPLAEGAKIAALACAGFRADHECYSAEETLAKLRSGMYAMIRESSVAHFLNENLRVITEHRAKADRIAFCTDDVTATDVLSRGHLDHLVRMAIAQGLEPMRAIQMATINCAQIYRIDHLVGSISPGRVADILLVDDLQAFRVRQVVAKGALVASGGEMTVRARRPGARGCCRRCLWRRSGPPTCRCAPTGGPPGRGSCPWRCPRRCRSFASGVTSSSTYGTGWCCRMSAATCCTSRWSSATASPRTGRSRSSRASACARARWPPPPLPTTTTSCASAPTRRTWPRPSTIWPPRGAGRSWCATARCSRSWPCPSAASSPTCTRRTWRAWRPVSTTRRAASAAGCPRRSCT